MTNSNPENFNFDEALKTLEGLVQKMESGTLSLEDSLLHFEQGVKLARQCQDVLKDAEQKVKSYNMINGEPQIASFSVAEE